MEFVRPRNILYIKDFDRKKKGKEKRMETNQRWNVKQSKNVKKYKNTFLKIK